MSPKIARKVIREFRAEDDNDRNLLSHKEINIIKGIEQGLTYKEIADRFCISPHTVHTHIKKIYAKLHVNSRSQAIYEALQQQLIKR